ncbi:hypothetical protein [Lacticaseibacillus absianus]|uniref:hypothetical protein n=1 Tax=Lacticaseibacillus absianus TaxID=2729623 RepID=UPI0015CA1314|nr:hypothetical protein [Lacticaseibacillus absianus]
MILIFAGAVQVALGLLFWVYPAKHVSGFYGYTSYLASITPTGYAKSQRWARQALLVTGALEVGAGLLIHQLGWDRLFLLWMIVAVFLFLPMFTYTERRLKAYLRETDQLPVDYVDPDEALKHKSKRRYEEGLRDRLNKR